MKKMGRRWIWGLVLILLGLSLLSNTLGLSGLHNLIIHWWPVIFVIFGLGELIEGETWNGFFWILIGVVVGLFTTNYVHYSGDIWQIIWSLVIILIGLRIIFRPAFRPKMTEEKSRFVGATAVFGGSTKKVSSKEFEGSSVNAVFGGAKLDLRDATISKEGAIVDVSAIFGGIEILVPANYPVRMNAVAIFGGQDDKRDLSKVDESLPKIIIRGEVIFGGIEIKS